VFVQVNRGEIEANLSLFRTDGVVRAAFGMLVNSLLAGSITFQTKNKSKNNRYDADDEAGKWRSKVFSNIATDSLMQIKAVGFLVYDSIDDEEHKNK